MTVAPAAPMDRFADTFTSGTDALADALPRLADEDAVSLPLLDPQARQRLIDAAADLPFRPARPVIGEGERAVHQEFDICMTFPDNSLFHAFAAEMARWVNGALDRLDPPLLSEPMRFNDLALQRYEPGSLGITAHRDHVRYEGLVALVLLSGAARFFVCADRSGRDAREVPAPAGHVLLMRAPGFAGRRDRPFHFLRNITRQRLSLGLRHDVRAA